MFRKILVPTDGSSNSMRACHVASELCRTFNGRVKVVYAVYVPKVYETDLGPELLESFIQAGNKILEDAARVFEEKGISVSSELVENRKPAEAIIELVERDGIDIVVISSHGLDDTRVKKLGSVTEAVLRHAKCSVLLVR